MIVAAARSDALTRSARQLRNMLQVMNRPLPTRLRRPPLWLTPDGLERQNAQLLVPLVHRWEERFLERVRSPLSSLLDHRAAARADSDADEVMELLSRARQGIEEDPESGDDFLRTSSRLMGQEISDFNRQQWLKILRTSFEIDLVFPEPWLEDRLRAFLHDNVRKVKDLRASYLRDIENLTFKAFRGGWRWEELAKQLDDRTGVGESRAEYLARNQVSDLNSELTQSRQEEVGIEEYFWRCSQDERVRGNPGGKYPDAIPSHWDREGESYEWAKPPNENAYDGHPGKPPNCRCTAEAKLQALYDAIRGVARGN